MMRRMIFPVVLGLGGAAILIMLGTWQVQRLSWKEAILTNIDARLTAAPVAVPEAPRFCLLYTSPSPRDQRGSRMPSSA